MYLLLLNPIGDDATGHLAFLLTHKVVGVAGAPAVEEATALRGGRVPVEPGKNQE